MKVAFKLDGDTQMVAKLKGTRDRIQQAVAAGVYQAANAVMTNAKQRAPLDTGVLRASGYVTLPQVGPRPRCEVGFGGAASAYALIQHERTEYHHEVGEAKYLEKAFNDVDCRTIIINVVRSAVDGASPAPGNGPHRETPE